MNTYLEIFSFTQERLNEMTHVSSNLTNVMGSNSDLDMQQR